MFLGTTIVAVRRNKGKIAVAGDGQVTLGDKTIVKHGAKKLRRLYRDKIIVGYAGSVADSITLASKFEEKLEQNNGQLKKAAISLAKEWSEDKFLRKLESLMIAADERDLLLISGSGEVIKPDDNVIAIGSGGAYALAAAKALCENTQLSAEDIVKKSLVIAADICIYTNKNISIEVL